MADFGRQIAASASFHGNHAPPRMREKSLKDGIGTTFWRIRPEKMSDSARPHRTEGARAQSTIAICCL
jgi:hypothetical protein